MKNIEAGNVITENSIFINLILISSDLYNTSWNELDIKLIKSTSSDDEFRGDHMKELNDEISEEL